MSVYLCYNTLTHSFDKNVRWILIEEHSMRYQNAEENTEDYKKQGN